MGIPKQGDTPKKHSSLRSDFKIILLVDKKAVLKGKKYEYFNCRR